MISPLSALVRSALLAAAVCLALPEASFAGRGGGGGGGSRGGYGGGGWGRGGYGGGYGGYGRGYGYGGYGRGYGYGYGGYGRGYYGYGRGFYGYGGFYGGFYGPYFGDFDYWPYVGGGGGYYGDYPPAADYFDGPALSAGAAGPSLESRRFYPPNTETAPLPAEVDRALVTVHLPPDAHLYFQGTEMQGTGPNRLFRSPTLEPGKSYRYDVRAIWIENGKAVEKTRTLTVQPGRRFDLDLASAE